MSFHPGLPPVSVPLDRLGETSWKILRVWLAGQMKGLLRCNPPIVRYKKEYNCALNKAWPRSPLQHVPQLHITAAHYDGTDVRIFSTPPAPPRIKQTTKQQQSWHPARAFHAHCEHGDVFRGKRLQPCLTSHTVKPPPQAVLRNGAGDCNVLNC